MNNKDITKMPVIGTLKTKVLNMEIVFSSEVKVPYTVPSEIYKIVAIEEKNGMKFYITNIWYKKSKLIPVIISEDIVKIYIPVGSLN